MGGASPRTAARRPSHRRRPPAPRVEHRVADVHGAFGRVDDVGLVQQPIVDVHAGARELEAPGEAPPRLQEAKQDLLEPVKLMEEERKGHVIAYGSQVAKVVGNAFAFEEQRPEPQRTVRRDAVCHGLHCTGIGQAMRHGRISGNPAGQAGRFTP